MGNIAMIKKLSTKNIIGKKVRLNEGEEKRDLYQVAGVASGFKSGESDFGMWEALTGNFAAQNMETGEQFRSGVLYLPAVALDPVIGQLNAGAQAVEFAFIIGVVADDSTAVGYTYVATPLVEPDENDPLEQLMGNFAEVKALDAPPEETAAEKKKREAAEKKAAE